MKYVAILVGAACLVAGSTLGMAASAKPARVSTGAIRIGSVASIWHARIPVLGRLSVQPQSAAFQAAGTGTVTTTPVGTGTVTPVPTGTPANQYPDPVQLLQNTFAVYQLLRSVHYELITDAERPGIEKAHLDAAGDATCAKKAINGRLKGTDTVEGTNQTATIDEFFIQIKTTVYLKSGHTHHKWARGGAHAIDQYGISVDNILFCSTNSGGSSGGPSSTIKDLVTLGPETFKGVAVWHIRATEVQVDQNGNTTEAQLDFLISQDHYLPYLFMVTAVDPTTNVHIVQQQILTQFGKKVKIVAPRLGSSKP